MVFDTVALLVIPGLILLTLYCRTMGKLNHFDYLGPMYLMDVRIDVKQYEEQNCRDCTSPAYQRFWGMVQVAFGSDWASCDPNQWCDGQESWVPILACEFCDISAFRCSTGNYSVAEDCLWSRYNLTYWEEERNWYPRHKDQHVDKSNDSSSGVVVDGFDPSVERTSPFHGDNMELRPTASFYGDCDSCAVMNLDELWDKLDHARNMKVAGSVLTGTGASFIILVLSCWRCKFLRQRRNQERHLQTLRQEDHSTRTRRVVCDMNQQPEMDCQSQTHSLTRRPPLSFSMGRSHDVSPPQQWYLSGQEDTEQPQRIVTSNRDKTHPKQSTVAVASRATPSSCDSFSMVQHPSLNIKNQHQQPQ
eukprot:CAMPEP_0172441806 /NCGR_PEP_ID=MMETSP1065-20121228/2311_1 /TAXON_ID=265537 /ORGANISM="Amphiprora paludosa, Strain CCMP125" /LENGTH=360 /DNA_ID=CAMNT_0013191359 /DNA_START=340 /DNA_END=1422 /DNA_ORIENTATION=-